MNDKLSLIDFFKKEEYKKIEIPKIQRDYAQGRKNEIEVANRFLDKIFKHLKENKILELDFIYGAFNKGTVSLLDGQQRITTLFLINWYIALMENRTEEIKYYEKFTYSTRTSSRDFCNNIIIKISDIKNYYEEININQSCKLSEIIKEFHWFTNENDQTIKAMLNMIDLIDEKYKTINEQLFDRLKNIQFYFLPLNDFNLTDEIYVKMNARGKPLTNFENFKAELIDYIKKNNIDIYKNNTEDPLSNLDNKYTNLFWKISKEHKENEILLDNLYIKFFYRITLLYSIINNNKNNDILKKEEKYSSFNEFEKIFNKDKNTIKKIFKILDYLEKNYDSIRFVIIPSWESENKKKNKQYNNVLNKLDFELKDRVVFSALIFYIEKECEKNTHNETAFKEWMRIAWNISENHSIDKEEEAISLVKLFNELSNHSLEIYKFLSDDQKIESLESKAAKNEVSYERRKCKLIIKDNNFEKSFIEAESHHFLKGYIDFIIDDDMDIQKFNHRKKMTNIVFGENGIQGSFLENHIFLRALISRINDVRDLYDSFTDKTELLKSLIKNKSCYMYCIIKECFDKVKDEEELCKELKREINKKSEINVYDNNDIVFRERAQIAYESLYKTPELQNWMQSHNAINVKNDYGNIYVFRNRSPYDRVLIGSYRNKLIKLLIDEYGFFDKDNFQLPYEEPNDRKSNKIDYFGCFEIYNIYSKDEQYRFDFDRHNYLYIYTKKKNSDEFKNRETYSYDLNKYGYEQFMEELKKEVLSNIIK